MSAVIFRRAYPRLLVGTSLTIAVVLAIYLSTIGLFAWAFAGFIALAICLAQWEYYQMAQAKGFQPFVGVGISISVAYLLALFLTLRHPGLNPLPEMVLLASLLFAFMASFSSRPDPLVNIGLTVFGVGYLALPLGAILAIAYSPFSEPVQDNRWWLFYLYAVTKMTDVGALAFGKLCGKHHLAVRISPNKTVEGALGGFCVAILISLLFAMIAREHLGWIQLHLTLGHALSLGALIGIVSQLGDLSESVLKRDANIKHSNQLPGLGGALDIVDSLVFTAPLLLFYRLWYQ